MESQTKAPERKFKYKAIKVAFFILDRIPGLRWIPEEERIHQHIMANPELYNLKKPEDQAAPIADNDGVQPPAETIEVTETLKPADTPIDES